MGILVRTCCCGCDLRTGILLIGIFGLLTSGYGIYSSYNSYKVLKDHENDIDVSVLPVDRQFINVVINLSAATIAFRSISTLANLLLLMSYGTLNRYLAYPWLFWEILMMFFTFGITIYFMTIWHGFAAIFAINIIAWLLTIYFIIIVYSYIEKLRLEPEEPARSVGTGQTGMPMQVQMQPPPYTQQQPYPYPTKMPYP